MKNRHLTDREQELLDSQQQGFVKGLMTGVLMGIVFMVSLIAVMPSDPQYEDTCAAVREYLEDNKLLYPDQSEDRVPGE